VTAATSTRAAPVVARRARACVRRKRARRAGAPPEAASTSSGMPVPAPKAAVSSRLPNPIWWVAPTTAMVARTGPAHGTYTSRSARPVPKPPRPGAAAWPLSRENGRSSSSSRARDEQPDPQQHERRDSRVPQQFRGQVQRVEHQRAEQRREAEARHQAADDAPGAARARGQHDGQDRQHAWGDAGDDPGEQTGEEQRGHGTDRSFSGGHKGSAGESRGRTVRVRSCLRRHTWA
jgi:hypothetical protein